MAGRGFYYEDAFLFLTSQNVLLAGFGLTKHDVVRNSASLRWLDSFFLTTFMQTGLIGSILFFGAVFIFTFIYFRDIVHMTKLQRLSGALLVMMLYYANLETQFFVGGPFDFTNWVLIILCMNDLKKSRPKLPHKYMQTV